MSEVFTIVGLCLFTFGISYVLGRYISAYWLGFGLAIFWIPALLLICPPEFRAAVLGAFLWSILPILVGYFVGLMRRPPGVVTQKT